MRRLYPRSLRVRLTLWYSCALILVALILAGASRWALAVSLDHALDQGLRYRLIGLRGFIEENGDQGLDGLTARLRGLDTLGELFQVFGPRGELMAQSDGLARHHVSTQLPPDPGARMLFRNAGPRWFGAPVYVAVDEHSFRRMLLILLDNAIKYTPAGGSIKVSLIEEVTSVAIAVADTGAGIPGDQLPFIFDRFWRADQVRSRDAGGTGLGLAIARQIAQSQGAELTVESSVGVGSTFTVRLPREVHSPLRSRLSKSPNFKAT